jgi:hypothetical protein
MLHTLLPDMAVECSLCQGGSATSVPFVIPHQGIMFRRLSCRVFYSAEYWQSILYHRIILRIVFHIEE